MTLSLTSSWSSISRTQKSRPRALILPFLSKLIPGVLLDQFEHRLFLIIALDLLLHNIPKSLSKTLPGWSISSPDLRNAKTSELIALFNTGDLLPHLHRRLFLHKPHSLLFHLPQETQPESPQAARNQARRPPVSPAKFVDSGESRKPRALSPVPYPLLRSCAPV